MRRWLYLCIAVLFIFACGKKIDVNVTPEDLCKLDSRLCPSPSPTPGPSWPPTPQPSPSEIPSPAPSPVPEPSPSPSPLPSPSPSPVVTPIPTECKTPQLTSDSWEVANEGCLPGVCPNLSAIYDNGPQKGEHVPASAVLDPVGGLTFPIFDFIGEHGAVVETIVETSGCQWKQNPCPTHLAYQQAHATIAAKLRAKGFCAGQHVDGGSDMIVVSTNPPFRGLWLEVHQVCGDDSGANGRWCWGKIEQSGTLWRIKGEGVPLPSPEPEPSPGPSAQPSTPPTPKPSHAKPKVTGGPTTIHKGQTATLHCSGYDSEYPLTHFGFHAPQGYKGKRGVDFNIGPEGGDTITLSVPGGATIGAVFHAYCEIGPNSGAHETSPNFPVTVAP